eukprot:TRINITY_DN1899_c0_g1_i2.p1 TRINITY_DN1899_c0_g1~~TRINITY_DN1899_c0_g1_i2.p1  ORF type:complete len:857 (+),score=246.36 TRINITY_DN1899_c0_g1_i2:279-2573(+)
MWCKMSNKKHKTYEDGIIKVEGNRCSMKDLEGKDLGKTSSYTAKTLRELVEGATLTIGQKEVEIANPIPAEEYLSGKIFLKQAVAEQEAPKFNTFKPKKFKSHATGSETKPIPTPRHSPTAPNALVLFDPKESHDSDGNPQVAVVVDPHLSNVLLPHQREGVKFMYECLMGLRSGLAGNGCILADEMGLGKTIQTITLIWTFLKQGPNGTPVLGNKSKEKVFIVTPASLVKNWFNEIKKWLGPERLKPLMVGEGNKAAAIETITQLSQSSNEVHPLLIISYEQFRQHEELLHSLKCGLVICDEGHRLKNSTVKTSKAISSLETARRIILSGTPIQNDLDEFFSMCDFCNPGILGTPQIFKKEFSNTIVNSRESSASKQLKKEGEARSAHLANLTNTFILRRTASIMCKYLPPKIEHVVFCQLSQLQVEIYKKYLTQYHDSLFNEALSCITDLKKLCNHPALLLASKDVKDDLPEDFDKDQFQPEFSGKFQVLDLLLAHVKSTTQDKIVLVSNSTKSLDMFEKLCESRSYNFLRLDGSTSPAERQKLVDKFNAKDSDKFLFLLSTKAGGVGLNLIGANRLILFDSDWNPAHDRQAMARVWRVGQTKEVSIYRMLSTGTIEEKIFQRQVTKQSLSNVIVDGKADKSSFTKDELRDLFTLNTETLSDTHDLLACSSCRGLPSQGQRKSKRLESRDAEKSKAMSEINRWKHTFDAPSHVDPVLQSVASEKDSPITFVFSSDANVNPVEVDVAPDSESDSKSEESESDD